MADTLEYGACDCCGKEEAVGVAAVPGLPMSISWGVNCLKAEVIPYGLAVANTALVGGLDGAATWWKELVERTIVYFDKSHEQFAKDVAVEMVGIRDPQDDWNPDESETEE